ncbi:hypothetical protein [Methylobacterium nodulans]|uniref:Uncharacterized protein n=1 Tax=Methylobacterium nodulans (strain LMG 21967 / CNCM I-2342 / ORS 2060) TaxID=460265 RepID=B8IBI9_METNO|nr:hypothetical protein [Methylobacterium nodulans]ACL59243.1 conserved hypothetical protein [Methylobacterium nodulans ORS 2060]
MRVLRWATVVLTMIVAGLGLTAGRSEAAALPTAGAIAAGESARAAPLVEKAQYYYRRYYRYRPYRRYYYRPYRRYYYYRPYRRYYYRPYYRRYYRPRFYVGY